MSTSNDDQIREHAKAAAEASTAERPLTLEVAIAVARILRS